MLITDASNSGEPTIGLAPEAPRKDPATLKRILVACDDTETARRALDRAAELARAFDSEVIVTSVAPLLVGSPRATGPIDPTDSPGHHAEELETARRLLSERGVQAELAPATGHPAAAIADEREADLVVIGTLEPALFAAAPRLDQSHADDVRGDRGRASRSPRIARSRSTLACATRPGRNAGCRPSWHLRALHDPPPSAPARPSNAILDTAGTADI